MTIEQYLDNLNRVALAMSMSEDDIPAKVLGPEMLKLLFNFQSKGDEFNLAVLLDFWCIQYPALAQMTKQEIYTRIDPMIRAKIEQLWEKYGWEKIEAATADFTKKWLYAAKAMEETGLPLE